MSLDLDELLRRFPEWPNLPAREQAVLGELFEHLDARPIGYEPPPPAPPPEQTSLMPEPREKPEPMHPTWRETRAAGKPLPLPPEVLAFREKLRGGS